MSTLPPRALSFDAKRLRDLLPQSKYFVTGIDTDSGKTIATGVLSSYLCSEGVGVITQKFIQTGVSGISDDIREHRRLEGRPLTDEDLRGITCPLVYAYPCSPHMAIQMEGKVLDLSGVRAATAQLLTKYEQVLIEGAGGLMVPLTETYLTIDYVAEEALPVILVTTAKLGSINHTLLSIEVLRQRGITLAAVVYNKGISTDDLITAETERYLRAYLSRTCVSVPLVTLSAL